MSTMIIRGPQATAMTSRFPAAWGPALQSAREARNCIEVQCLSGYTKIMADSVKTASARRKSASPAEVAEQALKLPELHAITVTKVLP